MVKIEKCEDCHQGSDALYHCSCGKWVCGDCGWYNHWQEAAQQGVQRTAEISGNKKYSELQALRARKEAWNARRR